MCVVLWYGMVLVAHPHDYPQTMHIFCGHREWGALGPPPSSPFLLRDFMLMGTKGPLGHRVCASTQTFVPWSEQMRVLDKKIKPAGYRFSSVIPNFTSSHGIKPPSTFSFM
jgi:hypothetical protein